MANAEVYPFASIGEHSGEPYPDWIRSLSKRNGVYLFRERSSSAIVYIGESHSDRLYSTLTRHFQQWSPKFNTAGPTYARDEVDVAVVLVPKTHAAHLQNELICVFVPRDNRLLCEQLFAGKDEAERERPRGYDYDVSMIITSVFYIADDEDVPF